MSAVSIPRYILFFEPNSTFLHHLLRESIANKYLYIDSLLVLYTFTHCVSQGLTPLINAHGCVYNTP